MVVADLKNFERYYSLNPYFKEVFEFIKSKNWENEPFEKFILKPDELFVIHANPTLLSKENQVLEYHKKYLDIHILLEGEEIIGHKPLLECTLEKQAFNQEDDFGLFQDTPTSYFCLKPNHFAIVFPEDAHAPIIGEGKVKKLIVKALA